MNEAEPITVACLDLAGTTVADGDAVESAFAEAIATLGIVSGTAAYDRALARFRDARGGPATGLFRPLFGEPRAQAVHLAFERSYGMLVDRHGLNPYPAPTTPCGASAAPGFVYACSPASAAARRHASSTPSAGGTAPT